MPDDPDEASLIQTVLRHRPTASRHRLPAASFARPGDDAALVGLGLVVTVDAMVEGVHWDDRCSAEDVGWKLAAVNASDIGAMGCRPTWALLTLSVPAPADGAWVEAFAHGLGLGLGHFGAQLVGGDTTRSPGPRLLTLTMAGEGARPVGRDGGRPGDELWVTGTLGEAAAGFFEGQPAGLAWLRRPVPPVELGAALGELGLVHAMMDLSDGLLRDLPRLCAASGTGATVDAAALPAGPALAGLSAETRLARQVAFGDDYQLLIAAAPATRPALLERAAALGVALHCVGHLDAAPGLRLQGGPWPRPDFDHFPQAAAGRGT